MRSLLSGFLGLEGGVRIWRRGCCHLCSPPTLFPPLPCLPLPSPCPRRPPSLLQFTGPSSSPCMECQMTLSGLHPALTQYWFGIGCSRHVLQHIYNWQFKCKSFRIKLLNSVKYMVIRAVSITGRHSSE